MFRKLLPLFLMVLPAVAQISPGTFEDLLDKGDDEAMAAAIREQCIDFDMNAKLLKPIVGKPDVLLALFECLQGTVKEKTTELAIAVARTTTSEGPATITTPNSANAVQRAEGILRTLMLVPNMRNEIEQKQNLYESRRLLTQVIRDNVNSFEDKHVQSWRDAGVEIPGWVEPLLAGTREAQANGFPTMEINVEKRTDFSGSIDERGVKVFMSLFMVKHTPDDVETFDFEDVLVYPHVSFPYTFNAETNKVDLHRLKNTEVTRMRLERALRKLETLELIPGKWGIRIQAYTGFGSIRADYSHYFEVKPSKAYQMSIGWKTRGDGVKRLNFDIAER